MEQRPSPGDPVVHAVHGPGKVVSVQTRQMPDGPVEYVAIDVESMRLLVPLSELEEVGIREPISREEAKEILELLGGDPMKDPGHTGRRQRNARRLLGGDPEGLAKVIRSLKALGEESDKPLKQADKDHLRKAMAKLVAELSISLEVSEEEAEELVWEATGVQTSAAEPAGAPTGD